MTSEDRAAPRTEAAVSEFVSFEGTPEEHQRARAMAARFAGDRDRREAAAPQIDVAEIRRQLEKYIGDPRDVNSVLREFDGWLARLSPPPVAAVAEDRLDVNRLEAAFAALGTHDGRYAGPRYRAELIAAEYADLTPLEVMGDRDRREAAAPGAAAPAWLIYYDDPDRTPELFAGEGAEAAARARSEVVGLSWNHYLFAAVTWPRDTSPSLRATPGAAALARIDVERLARALAGQDLYHGRYGTVPAGHATAAAIADVYGRLTARAAEPKPPESGE